MKRLKQFKTSLLFICVLPACWCWVLYASETAGGNAKDKLDAVLNNPPLFDYDLYYEIQAEKRAVGIQKGVDLQMLIAALIAYTEGQYERAAEGLTKVSDSDYIVQFVERHADISFDGLVQSCQERAHQGTTAAVIVECDDCGGTGVKVCSICRGVGKTKDRATQRQSVCVDCGGLGGRVCRVCDGSGLRQFKLLPPAASNAAIEELIVRAVYEKNSLAE